MAQLRETIVHAVGFIKFPKLDILKRLFAERVSRTIILFSMRTFPTYKGDKDIK